MASNKRSMGIVFLFLAILAGAFAGSLPQYVGINPECEDGLDNDGDLDVDIGDQQCLEYPYADGNGESDTPMNQRYTSNNYVSLFDWHLQNAPPGAEGAIICTSLGFGYYNADDVQSASAWVDQTGTDCSPYLP